MANHGRFADPAFWRGLITIIAAKLLLTYCYKSTDFEVHRNWMAITTNLEMRDWYVDNGSMWTLDYPPNFAYLELALGHVANYFDANMTELTNYDYDSENTVIFMRTTVIAGDVLLYVAMHSLVPGSSAAGAAAMVVFHPGLVIVDNVHFQYNAALYALLVFSFAEVSRKRYISGAIIFTVLVCSKHIYLYMAPAYFIFYLKKYVLADRNPLLALLNVGCAVLLTAGTCLYPFLWQIETVLKRMFPWGRGLCHAYWAPNFYALYNTADIALRSVLGVVPSESCVNTKGLVDTYVEGASTHAVLPSISPRLSLQVTVSVVAIYMLRYWGARLRRATEEYIELVLLCALSSAVFFSFSWHVHEKAILMVSLPLTAILHCSMPPQFHAVSNNIRIAGTLSLFPLLYELPELPLKLCIAVVLFSVNPQPKGVTTPRQPLKFEAADNALLVATLAASLYQSVHAFLPWGDKFPFLPLLALSVTAGTSLLLSFARLSHMFFTDV